MNSKAVILGTTLILIALILSVNANAYFIDKDLSITSNCLKPAFKNFNLINNSSTKEHYTITAKGLHSNWININSEFIGLEPLSFYLNANEKKEMTMFIVPECNTKKGLYEVNLVIREGNTESTEKIKAFIEEVKEITMSLSEETLLIEKNSERIIDLKIKNNSPFTETINLSVSNYPNELVSFSERKPIILAGKEKTIKMKVKTPDYLEGIKTITITARIQGSTITTEKELKLNIVENKDNYVTEEEFIQINNEKKTTTAFFSLNESSEWALLIIILLVIIITVYYIYSKRIMPTPAEIEAEKRTRHIVKQLEG